jgi:pimeloyl-ACP methyl ester carboxylesterase
VRTVVGGTGLRSIHQAAGAGAPTVVLLHGWPDSFLRFERVLPLLTDLNDPVPEAGRRIGTSSLIVGSSTSVYTREPTAVKD